jgi:hypothetical protein
MSVYTFKERRWLYLQMKELNADDTRYIYHLLERNKEAYSTNSNGSFFDLERANDDTVRELFIYYKTLRPLLLSFPNQHIAE